MSSLDAAALERELAERGASIGRPLSVVPVTGSTNDDARGAALSGAPHGATFLADAQRSGRGRGGHVWHSPPGENLYLSVVLRPRVPARSVASIALVVGLVVASVAERLAAERPVPAPAPHGDLAGVRLKWPNDVLVGGRKLAGVLVEGQLRGDAVSSLVVGIGLNVHAQHFPRELDGRATSLALLGCGHLSREQIAAELLHALGDAATTFESSQLAPFLDDLARVDWLRGQRVEVGGVEGVASGIDPDGHLLIRGADGVLRPIASGEVRVLPG